MLRLETRGEHAAAEAATARERGYAALKSIAAYRGGLDRVSEHVVAALEANEATGDPLPVQVHCGFGDSDLHLWRADPSYLKQHLERFRNTTFVCWSFVREAGWVAVYGNVYRSPAHDPARRAAEEVIREALELAPVSKPSYASDARTPEPTCSRRPGGATRSRRCSASARTSAAARRTRDKRLALRLWKR